MRRSLLFTATVVLATIVAVPPMTAGANAPRKPTPAFCTAMERFLGFIRDAGQPSELKSARGRKMLNGLTHAAPRPVAKPVKTLVRALERMRDHGKNSLTRRENNAASAALLSAAQFAADHCSNSPAARQFAQLLVGAKTRAQERAVQSSLRNGLTNAKGIFTDSDSYAAATVAALQDAEPSLSFTDGATSSGNKKRVSVHVFGPDQIVMAAGTGTVCFFIRDSTNGAGTEFTSAPGAECNATLPPSTWATSW